MTRASIDANLGAVLRVVLVLLLTSPAAAQDCADDALSRAAAEVLLREDVSSAELTALVRAAGSDAPAADALVIRDGDASRRARFLERVAARRDGPVICGEAQSDERWVVLAAARLGTLEAIDDASVRVAFDAALRAPRLYATGADGSSFEREVRNGEIVHLPSDLAPPIRVQLVAASESGPHPIAERDLGAGSRLAHRSAAPIEDRIDELRAGEDAPALRPNRILARAAEAHAERVCRLGRVAHVGEGGDPRERLFREGISARRVGEVVARVEADGDAYGAAIESPSHRAALVDPRFTDAGIGTSRRDGHSCLVVLLAAWPRVVGR